MTRPSGSAGRPRHLTRKAGIRWQPVTSVAGLPSCWLSEWMLWVDAADLGGFGDAADGEQVGAHAEVAVLLVALGVDGVEAADHDLLQAVVDLVFRPEEVLEVLHPLEV